MLAARDLILGVLQTWKHLYLAVSSIETTAPSSNNDQRIAILFDTIEDESDKDNRLLHKLNNGVPLHDVRPPQGITSLRLEGVYLGLTILNQLTASSSKQDAAGNVEAGHQAALTTPDSACYESPSIAGDAVLQYPQESAYLTPPSSQEDRVQLATHTQKHHLPCSEISDKSLAEFCKPQIVNMIMLALETVFLGGRSKSTGMEVISSDGFQHLTSMVPELWNRRFHREVSRRTTFLPTVSRALTNMGHLSRPNADIKDLVCELSRAKTTDIAEPGDAEPRSIQSALSLRLWHHARETLLRNVTPLRPLKAIGKPCKAGATTEDCGAAPIVNTDVLDEDQVLSVVDDDESDTASDSDLELFDDQDEPDFLDVLSDKENDDCWDCASAVSCDSFGLCMDDRESSCDAESDLDLQFQEEGSVSPSKSEDRPLGCMASHVTDEELLLAKTELKALGEDHELIPEGHGKYGGCHNQHHDWEDHIDYDQDGSEEMLDLG